jgi:hypothetical protein
VDEVLFGGLSSGGSARVDWRDGEYRMDILNKSELLAAAEVLSACKVPQVMEDGCGVPAEDGIGPL